MTYNIARYRHRVIGTRNLSMTNGDKSDECREEPLFFVVLHSYAAFISIIPDTLGNI